MIPTQNILRALLVYPGLLFGLVLVIATWGLLHGVVPRLAEMRRDARAVTFVSGLLALLALALLPWPLHPFEGTGVAGAMLLAWALLEAAFLLPLLRELTADEGIRVRAAIREAQMGTAGRVVIWLALGTATWDNTGWSLAQLPGSLLLALAATLALGPALGRGPFGAERSIAPLPEMAPLAAAPRNAALIAGVALIWVPPGLPVPPALALALVLLTVALLAWLLQRIEGLLPRLPLPLALGFCWGRLLPLVLAGLVVSALT